MGRAYSHELRDWIEGNPTVKDWHAKKSLKSENTAEVYASMLWKYWKESLAPRGYGTIAKWVEEVTQNQKSGDIKVRRSWGEDLEKWFTGTTMMEKSRGLCVWAVTSYLKHSVGTVEAYEFNLMGRAKRRAQRKASKVAPLTVEELRRLVNEANTRDKAVILCQVSGGMGVAEFLQFAGEWKKYEKDIRARTIPIKVELIRPKTDVDYYTFLWDDSVNALADLLAERERTQKNPEVLFVNQHKKPLSRADIVWSIARLRDRTGLDPKRPKGTNKAVYRVRPHEFRDYFKTVCHNSNVLDITSEFAMGHKLDDLGYNKSAETPQGEEKIRMELSKARPKLNVFTGMGTPAEDSGYTYYTEAIENMALSWGVDAGDVAKVVIEVATRSPEFHKKMAELQKLAAEGKLRLLAGENGLDAELVLKNMTREELLPTMISVAKAHREAEKAHLKAEFEDKVVDADTELAKYLAEGWQFVSVVNSRLCVVRRPKVNEDFDGQPRNVGA